MEPKPAHLGRDFADQFQDAGVVDAYEHRPPYPADLFAKLRELAGNGNPRVLEVGCGTGDVTFGISAWAGEITAVEPSREMLQRAQRRSTVGAAALTWLCERIETAPLEPPYDLVVAAESLHWTAWEIVLPRLAELLSATGVLALVERD